MTPRVLLIGGHGKISLLLTPMLLARSWNVTSLIRDAAQSDEILSIGKGQPGKINVLVRSLDEVKSDNDAQKVLDEVKPDYVVWSAGMYIHKARHPSYPPNTGAYVVLRTYNNNNTGAGGKGGPERTYAIDGEAAKHFISSAIATPSVSKFLMISYLGSRRNRPAWWSDEDWSASQKSNKDVLPHYYAAKVEADEHLAALARKRADRFQAVCLRPGSLSDDVGLGKVSLGKTAARGKVSRADVADVAVRLLERKDTRGWYDLLAGDEDTGEAVERVVREKIDCSEGEAL